MQVLIGPNASGKSTFMDVVGFLGDLVSDGLTAAVEKRTPNFLDLAWRREPNPIRLAVELEIPFEIRELCAPNLTVDTVRYRVDLGIDEKSGKYGILSEYVTLMDSRIPGQSSPWPPDALGNNPSSPDPTIGHRTVAAVNGVVEFKAETTSHSENMWPAPLRIGQQKSALGNLPEDETLFPIAVWLKTALAEGIQPIDLDSAKMQMPSPPGLGYSLLSDGANLAWVVSKFRKEQRERFLAWIAHLQTAFPDLKDVDTRLESDNRRELVIKYENGLEVLPWMASVGTLRLIALTLIAYLPETNRTYLIEEPETGIHPRAIETIFQSLSSAYDSQVLISTHSPVFLNIAEPHQLSCFSKLDDGSTKIVAGDRHPALQDWKRETPLGTLYAGGVLE
jgi:predicted ATPase